MASEDPCYFKEYLFVSCCHLSVGNCKSATIHICEKTLSLCVVCHVSCVMCRLLVLRIQISHRKEAYVVVYSVSTGCYNVSTWCICEDHMCSCVVCWLGIIESQNVCMLRS